ncbi:hypothetical protein AOXY_G27694 [Acipenser oxyrinchus oxyrinchus]|uniref:Immunoglobulin domain-containing protein n=1 Tax=Acipenser oxyrinchus oxyrinchus TaxID=40147 RepID=A0AAD8CTU0_ACIOX|nr:hypothetical protein AOXY_G27694 [Acipenser oxyrinchus oxyrinchus]
MEELSRPELRPNDAQSGAGERRVVIGDDFTFSLHSNKSNLQVEFRPKSEESAHVWFINNTTVRCDVKEYERRVSVRDKVLHLSSVTKRDEGSYTVWEKRSSKAVKNVRLSVEGRKENVTLSNGEAKEIRLDRKNVTVWFKPKGAVNSSIVDSGAGFEQRVSVQDGVLTLRSVTKEEEGTYTVLDTEEHEVSTITVTVEDSSGTERRSHFVLIAFAALFLTILAVLLMCKWIKTQNEQHVEML